MGLQELSQLHSGLLRAYSVLNARVQLRTAIFQGKRVTLTSLSDLYGGGFIIDGDRVRGKIVRCRIDSKKEDGSTIHLNVACTTEVATEKIAFDKDDLYDEAARIVVSAGQPSISYLQRRLRIGFSRAARLVDMMEAEGLVSPATGGKPREVLVQRNYFEEVDAQLR